MLLAHLSDVHALSLDGVSPLSFFNKRIAGGANLLLRRRNKHPVRLFESLIEDLNEVEPDHVAITGDLTNLSLDPEFALARRLLDRIRLGPSGVSVVPGNHDVYVWMARLRRSFERALAPYVTSDVTDTAAGGAVDGDSPFPLVRVRGELAVIGISTALPSPVPLADGWVGKRQLAAVESALSSLRGKFRVVLLHHPPVDNRAAFLRGLRDRKKLQAVIARAGAELVLHGHEHRDLHATLPGRDGDVPVWGVGSATYDDPRPERRARYRLFRIDGGRFTVETRVHDAALDRFVAIR